VAKCKPSGIDRGALGAIDTVEEPGSSRSSKGEPAES
jgi:hypothetical protein